MALSNDLRQRILDALENGEGGSRSLAVRFCVGRATVVRLKHHVQQTGDISPKPHGGGRQRAFSEDNDKRLCALVKQHPDATLESLIDLLEAQHGFSTNKSTLARTLNRLGISLKKSRTMHQKETLQRFKSRGRRSTGASKS
jgi:transposase